MKNDKNINQTSLRMGSKASEQIRIRAVQRVLEGESPEIVIKALGYSRASIYNWLKKYRNNGWDALKTGKRTGRPRKLDDEKIKILEGLLIQGATFHGWQNEIWTGDRVAALIENIFDIKMSSTQVRRILKYRLGWTPQKPISQRSERDEAEINRWKRKEFAQIRDSSWKRNAYLIFIDETGFMLTPLRKRSYAPKGHTPIIKITDPHGRISAIAAITLSPIIHRANLMYSFLPDNINFNSKRIIEFINYINKKIPNPITIIWDSIPIHLSNSLVSFINNFPEIVCENFPPYAPELNPVDRVWAYIKYGRLANLTPFDLTQLRSIVNEEFLLLKTKTRFLHAFIRESGLNL